MFPEGKRCVADFIPGPKMSDRAAKRIQKELAAMLDDPPPGCSIVQMGDDLFRWQVEVQGPPDSPFEGATFTLLVTFPTTYPFKPPKVQFETRIYHPNINQRGDICLDTLSTKWVPSISMAQVNVKDLLPIFIKFGPKDLG